MARRRGEDLTDELKRLSESEPGAEKRLAAPVYDELKAIARAYFRALPSGHTLQPTALVNEAYLRLFDGKRLGVNDRLHFYALAAKVMRELLVDHARRRAAAKRGGDLERLALDEDVAVTEGPTDAAGVDVTRLHAALTELEHVDPRRARVVELRYFGDLKIEDVAEVLDVSTATVERDWRAARAWLGNRLEAEGE